MVVDGSTRARPLQGVFLLQRRDALDHRLRQLLAPVQRRRAPSLVTIEAITGVSSSPRLATGVIFARFAHPQTKILFSDQCRDRTLRGRQSLHVPHCKRAQQPAPRRRSDRGPKPARDDAAAWRAGASFLLPLEREKIMFSAPALGGRSSRSTKESPLWGLDESELPGRFGRMPDRRSAAWTKQTRRRCTRELPTMPASSSGALVSSTCTTNRPGTAWSASTYEEAERRGAGRRSEQLDPVS